MKSYRARENLIECTIGMIGCMLFVLLVAICIFCISGCVSGWTAFPPWQFYCVIISILFLFVLIHVLVFIFSKKFIEYNETEIKLKLKEKILYTIEKTSIEKIEYVKVGIVRCLIGFICLTTTCSYMTIYYNNDGVVIHKRIGVYYRTIRNLRQLGYNVTLK